MYQQMMMMQQQMLQLGAMVDNAHGTNEVTQGLINQFGMQMPGMATGGAETNAEETEALGGDVKSGESSNTKKARQRVADSTSPT